MKHLLKYVAILALSIGFFASCTKDPAEIIKSYLKPPTADAGNPRVITLPVSFDTLRGTAVSYNGAIHGYLWSVISGPSLPTIERPSSAATRVSNMIAGTYKFQFAVIDSAGLTGIDTTSITVLPAPVKILTLQPGATDGQDAVILARAGDPNSINFNFGQLGELNYSQWTYSANGFGEGTIRSFIKFTGVSSIPATAEIISAKLSLYGVASSAFAGQGNSHYPGSPYGSSPDNNAWLKLVTGNWDESTLTWATKPGTTDVNQLAIAGTASQWNHNVTDIDVSQMVKTMVSTNANYGFGIQLQNETIYKNVIFASSEASDSTRRPKLVVVYR
jgi:hypothetical protein